jgi:hypothetical protein
MKVLECATSIILGMSKLVIDTISIGPNLNPPRRAAIVQLGKPN